MGNETSASGVTRREFLQYGIAAIGGLIAAVFGGVGGGYFLSPLFQKKADPWVDVGAAKDFQEKVPTKVDFTVRKKDAWSTIESRSSAWVVTADRREFIAFDPKCTHLGCPFRWDGEKKQFLCPCHTAQFAVDGQVVSGPPPRPLDRYPTKIVGGRVLILPQVQASAAGAAS